MLRTLFDGYGRRVPQKPFGAILEPSLIEGLIMSTGHPQRAAFHRALGTKGLAGTTIHFPWKHLEPAPGQYRFDQIETMVNEAIAAGLKVQFSTAAGKGTPEWLYAAGAPRLEFKWVQQRHSGQCEDIVLPPPWNPVFLDRYGKLLHAMGRHFGSRFTQARLAGINLHSSELHLPVQTPKDVPSMACMTDSMATWRAAGVSADRLRSAWSRLIEMHVSAFPHCGLSMSIIPGGLGADNAQGFVLPGPTDLPEQMVAMAAEKLPGRLQVEFQTLHIMDPSARPQRGNASVAATAKRLGIPVAWQTNNNYHPEGGGASCGGDKFGVRVPCSDRTFKKLLESGLRYGPQSIEIFANDAARFTAAIEAVAGYWTNGAAYRYEP